MSERVPAGVMIEGLRIVGFADDTAPNGRAAIAFKMSDGSRVLVYADDNPDNPTGVSVDWIPGLGGQN